MPPLPRRASSTLAALAGIVGLAGCGDDAPAKRGAAAVATPAPAAAALTVVDREAPAADAVVAEIQQKIVAARAQGRLDTTKADWKSGGVPMRLPQKPAAAFDPARTYLWVVRTDVGTLRVKLWPSKAPKHVANALYLSLLGFYDDTVLYKITPGKVIEGGCPVGDGLGSPGFALEPEPGDEGANAHARRGLLASTGIGGSTDDSKFRILLAPDASFDRQSTVFGEVVDGEAVLRALEALGTDGGRPSKRIVVQRIDIAVF
jgi:cyclophilin family peptidyl-prolyl cis-trans isomerase